MNSRVISNGLAVKARSETEMLNQKRRWSIALSGSGVAGAVFASFAVFFATIALLHLYPAGMQVDLISTILIAATFSIFIFAAHCLDKIDQAKSGIREAKAQSEMENK